METARALLSDSGLPNQSCRLSEECETASDGMATPWEMLDLKKPNLDTMQIFGSPYGYMHVYVVSQYLM
jgi:hypothetical protein